MAAKRKSKKNKDGAIAETEAQTKWSTGANPHPIPDEQALSQEPITREPHGQPYTRELPTEATATELAVIAHRLADVLDEEKAVKEEKREANAVYRQKLAGLDDQKAKLSECVKTDRKLEQVQVQEFLRSDNLIEVVRTDTGAVFESRSATSDDLQRTIPLDGVNGKVAHKKLSDDDDDDDDTCEECGGENDVHEDGCSHVKAPEVCEHCGIVSNGGETHRGDCPRSEGDPATAVTDPSEILAASADREDA